MTWARNPNIEILEIAARALGPVCEDLVDLDQSKGAPICRWIGHEIILDVMPTDAKILGFANMWYASSIRSALRFELPSGNCIELIEPAHFLATKFAAFDGRGGDDYVMSHDLEDVICVLDGRLELEDEILGSAANVRSYVCGRKCAACHASSCVEEEAVGVTRKSSKYGTRKQRFKSQKTGRRTVEELEAKLRERLYGTTRHYIEFVDRVIECPDGSKIG